MAINIIMFSVTKVTVLFTIVSLMLISQEISAQPCQESGGQCESDFGCCLGTRCNSTTHKCEKCGLVQDDCTVKSDCCYDYQECTTRPGSIFEIPTPQCSGTESQTQCNPFALPCLLPSDCCSKNCTILAKGSIFGDGGICDLIPCNEAGKTCLLSSDCCSGNCTLPVEGSILSTGTCDGSLPCSDSNEQCSLSSDCCSGNCTSPVKGSIFEDFGPTCGPPRCNDVGKECKLTSDCCSGNCTLPSTGSIFKNGICGDSPPCSASGGQCLLSSDCCSENCTYPAKRTIFEDFGPRCGPFKCQDDLKDCKLDSDCCSGWCFVGSCKPRVKIEI